VLLLAVGAAVGFLLLVLPGLVFLAWFAIAPALIEIEHRGIADAFRRSVTLVRGRFSQVLLLVASVVVITEGAAQALLQLLHGFVPELAAEIAVGGVLESVQGLVVALLAITLIQLHGDRVPAPVQ
jgi:hypothetical protein